MKKYLIVTNCDTCYHRLEYRQYGKNNRYAFVCSMVQKEIKQKVLAIPRWCPLPTYRKR